MLGVKIEICVKKKEYSWIGHVDQDNVVWNEQSNYYQYVKVIW